MPVVFMESLTLGLVWYLVFVISVTAHEGAHAWVGYRLGERTAHEAGLKTFHPWPHICNQPIGMIVVPILSYVWGGWMIGWAGVPYQRDWALRHPAKSAQMAMAGPTTNFLLMLAAGLFIRLGLSLGWFYPPQSISIGQVAAAAASSGVLHAAAVFAGIFFSLNLVLCVFNLIPLPPLDGSDLPLLFLSESASRRYLDWLYSGNFSLIGLFIAWMIFGHIFQLIHLGMINLLYFDCHYF
jgi:Zn-dependent protease